MPSNIFATTGTNVSVIFLDKSIENQEIIMIDASDLGTKVKEGTSNKVQKTILSPDEIDKIINSFNQKIVETEFSSIVSNKEIIDKKYSFAPAQFFGINIEITNMTQEEFTSEMQNFSKELNMLFDKNNELQTKIKNQLEKVYYDI